MVSWWSLNVFRHTDPNRKVRGANMGSIWGRQDPCGPHVGPMNFAIWEDIKDNDWLKRIFHCYIYAYSTLKIFGYISSSARSQVPWKMKCKPNTSVEYLHPLDIRCSTNSICNLYFKYRHPSLRWALMNKNVRMKSMHHVALESHLECLTPNKKISC